MGTEFLFDFHVGGAANTTRTHFLLSAEYEQRTTSSVHRPETYDDYTPVYFTEIT